MSINVLWLTNGKKTVYVTRSTFHTADIGVTVFLPNETEKIEAALKKMREEERA